MNTEINQLLSRKEIKKFRKIEYGIKYRILDKKQKTIDIFGRYSFLNRVIDKIWNSHDVLILRCNFDIEPGGYDRLRKKIIYKPVF